MVDLKLLPCPFCGSTNLYDTGNGVGREFIECCDCGASGPSSDHGNDAEDHWNRRAVPQASAHAIEDDFQHFLSYSNLSFEPEEVKEKLLKAYEANWVAGPQASAEQDALDAERYRWLRNPDQDVSLVLDKRAGWVPEDESVPGVGGYHIYEYRAGTELDEAIDAAIRAASNAASASTAKEGGNG